ncbi:hypothetical protein FRC16_001743 [Serendipita sp. 398]|nr:hypothetical protein FRC16_001743 [Serendipita sp. 398]
MDQSERRSRMTVATTHVTTKYARAVHGWAYVVLGFWSIMLLIFTIVRLVYTLSPRSDTFLNGGRPFYEPCVMELSICALFGLIFSAMMIFLLRTRKKITIISRTWFEVAVLGLLWFLWIGGAGSATTIWPDLNFCVQFSPCRVLQAMMAWAWLGWVTITFILLTSIFFSFRARSWELLIYSAWEVHRPSEANFVDAHGRGTNDGNNSISNVGNLGHGGDIEVNTTNYDLDRWRRAVSWLQETESAEKNRTAESNFRL